MTTSTKQTHIAVFLEGGRELVFPSGLWRREDKNVLVIDSEEDPPVDERRTVLAIFVQWLGFKVY